MKRRDFIKYSMTGLGAASGLATNLASFNAFAADTSDYKALVCVFFAGGQDGNDLIIPYDAASSLSYETLRAPIIDTYASEGYNSRRRANLLALQSTGSSGSVADGREFALSKEMQPLADLYHQKKMAVVGNIGPLIQPTTADTYNSVSLPPRLFSHNDQQSIWMASHPEGAQTGWGGKFADVMNSAYANVTSSLTTVKVKGDAIFVTGLNTTPFSLSTNGGLKVNYLNGYGWGTYTWGKNFTDNLYGKDQNLENPFRRDIVNRTGSSIDDNILVSDVFANGVDVSTVFPDSDLASQLKVVAKMIANRDAFGMKRQIFIVQDGGYDTHSNQGNAIPKRQSIIANAMAAFYNETVALGVEDKVMQFTASDFGRSLIPNNTGTDHGWGSHHLVVGGGVNGGQIHGDIPDTDGNPSSGLENYHLGRRKSLIPQLSVDQYAYSMARWFGLTANEALQALPNAMNFDTSKLLGLHMNS